MSLLMPIHSAQPIFDTEIKGRVTKHWYNINRDGFHYMVKGNSRRAVGSLGAVGYQPYSEVMASRIANFLNIPHIPYCLAINRPFHTVPTYGIQHVSVCPEYKAEGYYSQTLFDYGSTRGIDKNIDVIDKLKADEVDLTLLHRMLVFDALIGNPDRHLNKIELLIPKENNSKGKIHFSPLLDSGASLLGNVPTAKLPLARYRGMLDRAQPFKKTHKEQLKLVPQEIITNITKGLTEEDFYTNLLTCIEPCREYLSSYRYQAICNYLKWRLQYLYL